VAPPRNRDLRLEPLEERALLDAVGPSVLMHTPTEVRNWIKKVDEVHPREVHLGTVAARKGGPKPLSADRLGKLAAEVTEKTGIPAQVSTAEAVPA
jgi:hypothetical protein